MLAFFSTKLVKFYEAWLQSNLICELKRTRGSTKQRPPIKYMSAFAQRARSLLHVRGPWLGQYGPKINQIRGVYTGSTDPHGKATTRDSGLPAARPLLAFCVGLQPFYPSPTNNGRSREERGNQPILQFGSRSASVFCCSFHSVVESKYVSF